VLPVSTATNTPGKPIRIGATEITIDPNGKTAYASSGGGFGRGGAIIPINLATNRPGKPIPIGQSGFGGHVVFTPDGKTGYVAGLNTVTPINTDTKTAGKPIRISGSVGDIAITLDGKTAYVAARFEARHRDHALT
jgi:DNA-binding beta-propeller fold protein YncE